MRAEANVLLASVNPEVILYHRDKKMVFSVSVFTRKVFQENPFVFHHLNQYWASLSEEAQDKIWQIYERIQHCFDNPLGVDLESALSACVKDLEVFHSLEGIDFWIGFKSDIIVPDKFSSEYVESIDNNATREKTYTRTDYVRLVTLSLSLRCMIPIWGEYIYSKRQETGNRFKEFSAFRLLNDTQWIHSPAMEKLKTYIEHIVGDDKADPTNILNAISSEDFSHWLLGLTCVRRLCLCDIRGVDPNINAVAGIYKFIIQKIRNGDNNFENIVKEKAPEGGGENAESKISTLERYKIKTNISSGEVVEMEYVVSDIHNIASRLSYKLERWLLDRSLLTSRSLQNQRILDPQMTLLRWVFKPVVSPKGLMYLPKHEIIQALGAVEAILWTRGFKYLAILATCHPIISDRDIVVSPVDSKMRVPEELSRELEALYPYTRTPVIKRISPRREPGKEINLAAESIDIMTDNLTMFSWRATCHEDMLVEVTGSASRKFTIRPDIRTELTKLVISIGKRDWL